MHSTSCYLFTCTLVSAHMAFGRVSWSSPSEIAFAGQVDVTGEIASLRALLYSAMQDREAAQRQTAELAQLAGAVLRAEEAQRHLEERERDLQHTTEHAMELQGERDRHRGEVQTTQSERDQLRILAEAAEAQVAEATKELATLWVQRPPGDQEESRSGVSSSRATGGSVGQYLVGSSSRRRNVEEERHRQGDGSAQSGRGGGEMPPPPKRQEGSGESGGG
ncbi:hypothetical protein Taro_049928, partial [Colocasia esculenta]|nr:hypothetical protein [Colocasia esculenta]